MDTSTLYQANRYVKLEGTRFDSLVVEEYLGSTVAGKCAVYRCKCDCGNTLILPQSQLAPKSKCRSKCKECKKVEIHNNSVQVKHKKAYKTWAKIKERCFNVNGRDYPDYGAKGITMGEEYVDSFPAFLAEVGDPPINTHLWSVDRIDNTKGYVKGNMRWANSFQQARNKGKFKVNTSGVTGVRWDDKPSPQGPKYLYAKVQWACYENGVKETKTKAFPVKVYGLLPAFTLACQFREDRIKELNLLGYGYSETHGK